MNKRASQYLFTTEGHIIKIDPMFRKPWVDYEGWLDSANDIMGSCLKNSTCGRQQSSKDCSASKMVWSKLDDLYYFYAAFSNVNHYSFLIGMIYLLAEKNWVKLKPWLAYMIHKFCIIFLM